jgi:hypothetical protein
MHNIQTDQKQSAVHDSDFDESAAAAPIHMQSGRVQIVPSPHERICCRKAEEWLAVYQLGPSSVNTNLGALADYLQ